MLKAVLAKTYCFVSVQADIYDEMTGNATGIMGMMSVETLDHQSLHAPKCRAWIITEGAAGMEAQALGVAEALMRRLPPGFLDVTRKKVRLRQPWGDVTPYLPRPALSVLTPESDSLAAPWPHVIIGVGRQSIAPVLALRQAAQRQGHKILLIQLQTPTFWSRCFDLVIPPVHDGVDGANVVPSMGACNRVTREKLAQEAEKFRPMVAHLPSPRVTVLVGGSSRAYHIGPQEIGDLADQLAALMADGFGVMVTPSRRTGADNVAILTSRLMGQGGAGQRALVWDGSGDNPYFGFLGLADAVLVTPDSVNMVSEAAATGKPVYVARMKGGSPKFDRFHKAVQDAGISLIFDGTIEEWDCPPLCESDRVADMIIAWFRHVFS